LGCVCTGKTALVIPEGEIACGIIVAGGKLVCNGIFKSKLVLLTTFPIVGLGLLLL